MWVILLLFSVLVVFAQTPYLPGAKIEKGTMPEKGEKDREKILEACRIVKG